MEFSESLGFAGVAFIGLIIGVIEAAKRFFPDAPSNVWFGISLILGLVLQTVYVLVVAGVPESAAEVFTVIILGLAFALAAGKSYDTAK